MKQFIKASTIKATTLGLLLCAGSALCASPALASDFGVGATAGTTGLGVEAKYNISDKFMVRGAYYYLSYERDEKVDDIDYTGDLDMSNFAAFADFSPFSNGFVISGGAHFGGKELGLHATPSNSVDIGGTVFTPADVGTLKGKATLEDFAPYVGLGYDGFKTSDSFSFNIRAGVMFTGSPQIELSSVNGLLSSDPTFLADLDTEIATMEDDISDYKYYPVINLGFTKKF